MGDPAKLRAPTPRALDQAATRTPTALNKVKPNRRTRAALARKRTFAADTMGGGNAQRAGVAGRGRRAGEIGPEADNERGWIKIRLAQIPVIHRPLGDRV